MEASRRLATALSSLCEVQQQQISAQQEQIVSLINQVQHAVELEEENAELKQKVRELVAQNNSMRARSGLPSISLED
jgi:hypothetical protein